MKTQFFRVSALAVAASGLILCSGGGKAGAQAEAPSVTTISAEALTEPAEPAPQPEGENASPAQPAVKVVQPPAAPEDVKASPALAEVIKLAHAGVSEEVMLSYIANSPNRFSISSDQIVYLNDLGVSTTVITSLIQHQGSPEAAPGKSAPPPSLAPNLVLTTPAKNVYPGSPPPTTAPAPDPGVANTPDPTQAAAVEPPLVPPDFYEPLSPYGSWIDVEGYGRCWQPTVAVAIPTWRPYCDRGHWIWTDCGWYWYSDYSWGWAPFHYGRWCSYPRVGWFWVPDTCWGPSWVSWRHTGSYCGWAPLPPAACFVAGVGFCHGGARVGFGFDFAIGAGFYTFLPFGNFCDRNPGSHFVSGSRATVIYNNSTVINNYTVNHNGTVVNHGAGVDQVALATGHAIHAVAIQPVMPSGAGLATRHEQLVRNGTMLAVAKSPVASASKPSHFSTMPATTPGRVASGIRSQAAPTTEKTFASAPSGSFRLPNNGAPTPAFRNEKPESRTTVIPPNGQPAKGPVQAQPGRTVNAPSAPASKPEMFRVYGEPAPSFRAANPRAESAAPSYGRPAPAYATPAGQIPSRPQYAPMPSMAAPPSYHSEGPRTPSYASHASAPAPQASRSAPAQSGSRSGSKN